MSATDAPSTPDARASRTLERLINNRLFEHKTAANMQPGHTHATPGAGPDHRQFLSSKVTTQVQLGPGGHFSRFGENKDKKTEILRLEFDEPHVSYIPSLVAEHTLKVLSEIPALKELVKFDTDKPETELMKASLEKFIDAGADLPKKLLEWNGFHQEKPGEFRSVPDYGLHINKDTYGYNIHLNGDAEASKNIGALVRDNLNERLPEIRKVLAARIAKYKGVADDAGKAAIQQQVDRLQIRIENHDYMGTDPDAKTSHGHISITIQSPEQAEAEKQTRTNPSLQFDQAKMEATNILSGLTSEQLGKSMGRAFLFGGEKAMDVFPYVAGRKDMQAAVGKSLTRLKLAKPVLAKEVDDFLGSELFKKRWEEETGNEKERPSVFTPPDKPGKLVVEFTLPAGKPIEVINAIANIDPAQCSQVTTQQVAPAADPLAFSHVNSVEVVGATTPDAAKYAQQVFAGLSPVEESLVPTAEQIIAKVEEAHALIERGKASVAQQLAQNNPLAGLPHTVVTNPQAQCCAPVQQLFTQL